eukprot:jgi/Tetstr1/447303/TSEL_034740.t1
MAAVDYSTLLPTGDPVTYDDANVSYPAAGVVDTFGTIWVSKVNAYEMSSLELASAGKLAFSPSNEHSLDLVLDDATGNDVTFRSRDAKNLVLQNESGAAEARVTDGGTVRLTSGTSAFSVGSNANTLDAGDSGMNLFTAPDGKTHEFHVGGSNIVTIGGAGASVSNLYVDGTDLRVPLGPETARPEGTDGLIFYNTTSSRFEGFNSGSWAGLGGVVDVDQNTYISAETAPGADDNELVLVTAGEERMRLDDKGFVGVGTATPEYAFDIVGDLRVSGNVIAASTTIGSEGGRVMTLAVPETGDADVVDGLETNDGAGISVAGVPAASAISSSRTANFEKSLKWHFNGSGMEGLAQKDAWESESYWKLRGGAFRMGVTNADTGSETEIIFRINERDELQLVKHVAPTDGTAETYDVIARFGKGPVTGTASSRGYVSIDADKTSMDTEAGTVDVHMDAFSTYSDYRIYAALYAVEDTPTSSEVRAAAAVNGFVSAQLPAASDVAISSAFDALADGSAVPDAIVKFSAVLENVADATVSPVPFTSFVLNDASIYDTLAGRLEEGAETQTAVTLEYTFSSLAWDDLSLADQAIFTEWIEDQLVAGAAEKGIAVTSVDLTIVSGSVKVTGGLQVKTDDITKVLKNTLGSPVSTRMFKAADTTPIAFQDRAAVTISADTVTTAVKEIVRIQTLPTIVSISEASPGASGTSATFAFEVAETNTDFAVTKIYALASPTSLGLSVLPSRIISDAEVQEFTVTATTGTVEVAMDTTRRGHVYFVAENNGTPVVRTNINRFIWDPVTIMLSSVDYSSSGQPLLVQQTEDEYSVTSSASIGVYTGSASATAYLVLYPADEVPGTAALVHADILEGGSFAVAAVSG